MAYLDVWKKKMQNHGENSVQAKLQEGKYFANREFTFDPSYRNAILGKLDLQEEPIDVRIVNVDRTTAEKKIVFRPDAKIDVGSFIKVAEKTYLIEEFEDNTISPYGKALFCNQTLNWKGLDKPIPCWCDNSSYGTKGVISSTYLNEYDGKILFYTQWNEKTKQIRQDMRFIFDNSRYSVYKVVDVNRVVTGNVLRLVMDKTEFSEHEDDDINGIAYNEWLEFVPENPTPNTSDIKSYTNSMEIERWNMNMFTVVDGAGVDSTEKWTIQVNYNNNPTDSVIVNEIGDNYIKLTNNGYIDKEIILTFTSGNTTINKTIRLVR